ncbi:MAG: mannose-1-phosphate guanylyltransferase [Bacteroidales bacterium]
MDNRYCVIMSGGIGSRFWPYSRTGIPKQFLDFFGTGRTLLQMTYDRLKGIIPKENILILTNEQYATRTLEQLPELTPEQILLEPARRNTAPCIAWAAYHIKSKNPNASMLVVPSDHLILKESAFADAVIKGFEFVENSEVLLTMGITPTRPETGYGYIQIEEVKDGFSKVKTFTEKPSLEFAKIFLASGEFYWNSGMFLWSVKSIISAFKEYSSAILAQFERGDEFFGTEREQEFINSSYGGCQNISIDFAIMEKASNVYVECVDLGWSDLGMWSALYDNSEVDAKGNATQGGNAMMYNSSNNIVAVKNVNKLVVVSGLDDYIIADTDDVLLIAPRAKEQKIKNYVNDISEKFGDKYL